MPQPPTAPSRAPWRTRAGVYGRVVRRVALIALVVAGAWFVWASPPQACADTVAGDAVARACGPMPVTDVRVIAFLLVVGALALPELSEVEVVGVLRLKRDLARTQAEVATARAELAVVQAAVASSAAVSHAAATASPTVNVWPAEVGRVVVTAGLARSGQGAPTTGHEPLGAAPRVHAPVGWDPVSAVLAAQAAMVGMAHLLPDWAGDPIVIGYVPGDHGASLEAVHGTPADADAADLATWAAFVNADPLNTTAERTNDRVRVAAPAHDARGAVVGALLADVRCDDPTDEQVEDLSAVTTALAGAYAGVLVGLLGEVASEPGPACADERE